MAIISAGYDGTVDEVQFAGLVPKAGASEYGVDLAGDFAVTAVAGQDRTVSVAPGKAWGHSVVDVMDANETRALSAPASGSRWDMIVVRRDWQPPGGATTIAVIQGASTSAALPGRNTGQMGVIDDQPIALVRVDSGSTTIGSIIDLRVWARNGGVTAKSDLVLQYLSAAGAVIEINNVVYRVRPTGTVVENYLDEVGAQPYRHFVKYTQTSVPNNQYVNLVGFQVGPGDQGDNTGLSYSGGIVTAARSGIYEIYGSVTFIGGIDADKFAAIWADGKRYRAKLNGGTGTVHVSRQLYLNAGATVALQAYQNSGGSLTIPSDGDLTYWTIRRIGR